MEKTRAQSDLPVRRKIQKTLQNLPTYIYMGIFGGFLGFFSKLVSPIELQFFPLAQCLSRACFDRSLDRSTTTLIFDPIIVDFQILRWPAGGSKFTESMWFFGQNLSKWSLPKYFGGRGELQSIWSIYTHPYLQYLTQWGDLTRPPNPFLTSIAYLISTNLGTHRVLIFIH